MKKEEIKTKMMKVKEKYQLKVEESVKGSYLQLDEKKRALDQQMEKEEYLAIAHHF